MRTKILFVLLFSLLAVSAGCSAEGPADSYSPAGDSNGVRLSAGAKQTFPAATNSPFTLDECIEIALKNNPEVVGGGWDVLTAAAEKDIAAGERWPSFGIESSYRHYLDDQRLVAPRYANEPGVFGDDIITGNMVLRMPIFTAGRIRNEIKAAELLAQSARGRLSRTRRELVFNVSQVFYNILAQRHIIESLNFSQKALREHHKRISDMIGVQKAAKVDLLRTDVRLADIEQRLVSEKNVMSILRRVLVNLLGISGGKSTADVRGDLQLTAVDANLPRSIARAYTERADYLAFKKQVDAQASRLDIARAGHWPIVSIEGTYGLRNAVNPTSHPSGTDETEDVGYAGVMIELPVFEGGAIDARVRREKTKLLALKQRLRGLELQIHLDVETAILNISSSKQRVLATQSSIEQAKESLRIEREKYALGKGSITNVLDAQAALLDAQTTYYHALAGYNTAVAQWELAIGEEK